MVNSEATNMNSDTENNRPRNSIASETAESTVAHTEEEGYNEAEGINMIG